MVSTLSYIGLYYSYTMNNTEISSLAFWSVILIMVSSYLLYQREKIDKLNFYAFTTLETTATDFYDLMENLPSGIMVCDEDKNEVHFKNTEFIAKFLKGTVIITENGEVEEI